MARLEKVWREVEQRQAVVHVERHGAYIEFAGEPGFDLLTKGLEGLRSGTRLLNVRKDEVDGEERTLATVYVPLSKRGHFLRRIRAFAAGKQPHKRDYEKLVSSISDIRRAVLESFWQDELGLLPGDDAQWVEVWLSSDRDEVLAALDALLRDLRIESQEGTVKFPERSVRVISANRSQLESLVEASDDIAEFRLAKEVASFFIELENREQLERVQELLSRTHVAEDPEVAVTILDSGVNNGHLLIQPVLNASDLHAVNPSWGTHDHDGHGTLMAGTATYGDLLAALNSGAPLQVPHCLESAKILPPSGQNPKRLWGFITAQGISRVEIQAPERKRIACMAVTSQDDRDRGRPSSWSGMLDALTSGYDDGTKRLFVVSAGNVEGGDEWRRYPESNLTNEVHDPGQAWNALTVGALTEKVRITDPTLGGYAAIAPSGGLSPYSTTASTWQRNWAIKPDVVFEGGNVARGPNDSVFDTEDLRLLSTYYQPHIAQFAPFEATSVAAAQAAWMAARILVQYPEAWPETIRALIVHTAEWTDTMKAQFLSAQPTKEQYARLLRICGYGVPDLARALYCAANSLTLISEAELQPYDKRDGGGYRTRDMHLYNLPWPSEALQDLRETEVEMRVTLSYYVEPGPGEVGWQDRYRYPSHALRFAVNGPGESEDEFVRRVNDQAREDGEHPGTAGPGDRWLIGGNGRNVGSIHSDIWQGRAADLAASNQIGVYPAVGWWRERHHLGRWNKRCRYSLIVSILTPDEEVDIYTPVAVQIGVAVPIEVTAE